MKKWAKRVFTIIVTMALMVALMPIQALANDTKDTLENIPIEGHDANMQSVNWGKASIKFETARFTAVDTSIEYQIVSYRGSKIEDIGPTGNTPGLVIDEGYGYVQAYSVYVSGIASESMTANSVYKATLTVPVPEGCTGYGAKRMYDWAKIWVAIDDKHFDKIDVTVNPDNTISFPISLGALGGGEEGVYGIESDILVEYKKITDIATLKDKAKTEKANYEYTGTAINPSVTITGLTKDTDYTVSYTNNTNAGLAKAIATGKGAYIGTLEIPFTIDPMPIEKKKADAKLSNTEFDYTGKAIEPEVTITGLTEGKDFTVAYEKNTDPGDATATITGMGNYGSSFTLGFTIKKAPDAPTSLVDEKSGAEYAIKTEGDTSEATYESAKSKDEKTVNIPDTVTLPDGKKAKVTAVAKNACKGNKKLTKATIGNNVKTVGDNAFNGCSNLTNLKFGKKVEKIGKGAARNCKKLKKVNLPASTKTIGNNAFDGDSNLKELTINCKNLKSVGKGAIKNINPKATIKLKGTAKQKKAAEKLITKKGTGYKKTMKIKK